MPQNTPEMSSHPTRRSAAGKLAITARTALSRLKPRRRSMIERLNGLWDGRIRTPSQLAAELGTSRANCGLIRDRAYARLARDLDSSSPRFKRELRAAFIHLLGQVGGMAHQKEWDDQGSLLFKNNREDYLAFSFLCRISNTDLNTLGVVSKKGVCFDSFRTKSRYDRTISAVLKSLAAAGRPIPLDALALDANVDDYFLRRCLQLSTQCGLDESKMASRRNWPFFGLKNHAELAHRAFLELERAATVSEILGTIELVLPGREPCRKSLINAMGRHPELFMRVGFRLYGLRTWGLEVVPEHADFLATELFRRGGKATSQDLHDAGRQIHGFKQKSLMQALRLHPERFRQSPGKVWELVSAAAPNY